MKMSKDQPDKLFREKLEAFEVKPEDAAWYKLETQLGQKHKKRSIFWYSVAAVVTILLAGSLFVINDYRNHTPQPIADKSPVLKNENIQPQKLAPLNNDPSLSVNDSNQDTNNVGEEISETVSKKEKVEKEPQQDIPAQSEVESKEMNSMISLKAKTVPEIKIDSEPDLSRATAKLQKEDHAASLSASLEQLPDVKIVYKSDEQEEPEKRGVDKILSLAKEVKNMDIGFGALREAKNELIAKNFNKVNNKSLHADKQEER